MQAVRFGWVAVATLLVWAVGNGAFVLTGHAPTPAADITFHLLSKVVGIAACVLAWRRWRERGWLLIAAAIVSWTAGEIAFQSVDGPTPAFRWGDLGYLGFTVLVGIGLAMLIGASSRQQRVNQFIDGVAVAFTVNSLAAAAVFHRLAQVGHVAQHSLSLPTPAGIAFFYPALDAALIGMVLGQIALRGWLLDTRWVLLGAGLVGFWFSDAGYITGAAEGTYTTPSVTDFGWMLGFPLLAAAALTPRNARPPKGATSLRAVVAPTVLGATALGLVLVGVVARLHVTVTLCAVVALAMFLARMVVALQDNRVIILSTRQEARTDPLTRLPNRRAFDEDLSQALADGQPVHLALYDLNGFKSFNDTFGHPAGDQLLIRLAERLQGAVDGWGRAYRLGGDEFCVLVPSSRSDALEAARAALTEAGDGYVVRPSVGQVCCPDEADDVLVALQLADQRMYQIKAALRRLPGQPGSVQPGLERTPGPG